MEALCWVSPYEMIEAVWFKSISMSISPFFWRCCHSFIDWFIKLSRSSSLIVCPSVLTQYWRFCLRLLFTLVVLLLLILLLLLLFVVVSFSCWVWAWLWWCLSVQSVIKQSRHFQFKYVYKTAKNIFKNTIETIKNVFQTKMQSINDYFI